MAANELVLTKGAITVTCKSFGGVNGYLRLRPDRILAPSRSANGTPIVTGYSYSPGLIWTITNCHLSLAQAANLEQLLVDNHVPGSEGLSVDDQIGIPSFTGTALIRGVKRETIVRFLEGVAVDQDRSLERVSFTLEQIEV